MLTRVNVITGEVTQHEHMQEPVETEAISLPPLTARQLRLGLVTNGFSLDQVGAAIEDIADPQYQAAAWIEWEYAAQFERSHPLIVQIGMTIGLSGEQIDWMWREALAL